MSKAPIPETYEGLPVVSCERMRALDQLASEYFGLSVLTLMENAGRAVAWETHQFLKESLGMELGGTPIVVCCGRGSNGGDGLVAARVLHEFGAQVSVFICPPRKEGGGKYPEPVEVNLQRTRAVGVRVTPAGPESGLKEALEAAAVVLDALLGTGSTGKPAGAIHHMIQEITRSGKPVLSIDIPSGLDPDTGYHSGAFVTAVATLTLGLPKRGLLAVHAKRYVGLVIVLDIGYPRELFAQKAGK